MPLVSFYSALIEHGHATIRDDREPELDEIQALKPILVELDRASRVELSGRHSGDDPALQLGAASWAAVAFHRAARLVIFERAGSRAPRGALGPACPETLDAGCVWSVDLTMRFLPDLLELASLRFAAGDEVRAALASLARDWPLSSVGTPATGTIPEERLAPVLAHPTLGRLYVDRVVERADGSRAGHPIVRRELDIAAGEHAALLPPEVRA